MTHRSAPGLLVKIARNRILQHVLFWVISWYILLNIFSGSSRFLPIDHLYTAIFILTLAVPVHINLRLLIPRYLQERKYITYSFWAVFVLLAGTLFNHVLFASLIDYILPGYYFISYYNFPDLLKFFFLFLFLTSLLKLAKEWLKLNEAREQLNLLEKEKLKAELQVLVNQVNPHFLFNSLTLLYSLALRKSEETPEVIIRLSDILRYVIYESGSDRVPISSEMKVIEDYMELQRFRVGPRVTIDVKKDITNDPPIAPMLLLQLVENSFKHGVQEETGHAFIKMRLEADSERIYFSIGNNKAGSCNYTEGEDEPRKDAGWQSAQWDEGNTRRRRGIGLNNIRERLRLTYKGSGSLIVKETPRSFGVELEIKLTGQDQKT